MKLVIFDLDGVIVSTDRFHYTAWKKMCDRRGYRFSEELNHRLRGVSRSDCLDIILTENSTEAGEADRREMLDEKNDLYRNSLAGLDKSDILPGAAELLEDLARAGIPSALGSSSRNARLILSRIGLTDAFAVLVDGTCIRKSKPDPEVFLKGAAEMQISARDCLVVEDAQAGIDAALAAGMTALGVGNAGLTGCHHLCDDLTSLTADRLAEVFRNRVNP